jgi:DNA polymerase-3 subunit delta
MAKKSDTSGGANGIFVINGKDKFLVSEKCTVVINSLLTNDEKAMSLFQADADRAVITDVLDELRTLPFLAKKRVVLIKDADGFISANRGALERYFDDPSPKGVLVMTVSKWLKSTKLAKKLGKVGQLIDIGEIKPWQLPKFAADYAKDTHGKGLNKGASELLVELVGDKPGRICSEVDKLAMYVGKAKAISAADVETLIGQDRMYDVFSVIDAMTARNVAGAVERLGNMFAADKSAEYSVVGAFAFHFRRMFRAKAMLDKGENAGNVARQLRIFGKQDQFFAQLRKLSLAQIGAIICELARMDYSIKTGAVTGKVAVEQLVLKMCV